MSFIADPANRHRVHNHERGYSLEEIVRDVPYEERWFRLSRESFSVRIRARFSVDDISKVITYTIKLSDLIEGIESAIAFYGGDPNSQRILSEIMPLLKEAIEVFQRRQIPAHRLNRVDVLLAD
jgi:hypothetical protein